MPVYGYFNEARRLPPSDEGNTFIESSEHGWLWAIPLYTGWPSVGAVLGRRYREERVRAADAGTTLLGRIASCPHVAQMILQARMVDSPEIVRDWSYVSKYATSRNYVLAEDVDCVIDPLPASVKWRLM